MKLFKPFLDELKLGDVLFPFFLFPYLALPLNLKPNTYLSPHLSYFSFFLLLVFLWHFFFLLHFFFSSFTTSVSVFVVRRGALRKRGKGIQYNDTIVESARQRQELLSSIGSLLTILQHKEGKIVCTLCVCPTSIHHH